MTTDTIQLLVLLVAVVLISGSFSEILAAFLRSWLDMTDAER